MPKSISKFIPLLIILGMILVFILSLIRGTRLVQKSEKEINPKKQVSEAQAEGYSLKEVDAKTGQLRWKLFAKHGATEESLQAALIKDITAEIYKNNEPIFTLTAPSAKANASTKEILLFGNVTAKDKEGNFLLKSNVVALGMGTSLEAQKGFNLVLKNSGTISGENALINDDQTKIEIGNLEEAAFKNIILSGKKVLILKEKNGDIKNAIISEGGKVVLKDQNNSSLYADSIKWEGNGNVEATNNVTYTSEDKIFKAGYLQLKPDKTIFAKDNVLILHGKTQCSGKSFTYGNDSKITLTGRPKAIQGQKQITADKIIYDINTEKVEATGNVQTTIMDNEDS